MDKFFAAIDSPGGAMVGSVVLLCLGWLMVLSTPNEKLQIAGIGLITSGGTGFYQAMKGQNGSKVSVIPKSSEPPKV